MNDDERHPRGSVVDRDAQPAAQRVFRRGGTTIRNATSERLVLIGSDKLEIELAPLERRTLGAEESDRLDHQVIRSSRVAEIEPPRVSRWAWPFVLAFYGIPAYLIVGWLWSSSRPGYWAYGGTALAAAAGLVLSITVFGGKESWLRVKQWSSLLCVAIVGMGIPALGIGFVGSVGLSDPTWDHLMAMVEMPDPRIFQWMLLSIASILPAALFFLFDRTRLCQLREDFIRTIFRLDRTVETLSDLRARYGERIEEAYGGTHEHFRTSLSSGHRSPVVIATLLLALGWTVAVVEPGSAGMSGGSLAILMLPIPHVSSFAFLGAYVLILFTVILSYVRRDLRPKTYGQMSVRIILAFVVGLVVEQVPAFENSEVVWALAFVGGMTPTWFVEQIIQSVRTSRRLRDNLPSLAQGSRLTELDGIDLVEQTRLFDEGITNVESLAHGDLVALLLETRVPAPQMMNWMDQAILYAATKHVSPIREDGAKSLWEELRRVGVSTATALDAPDFPRRDHVVEALVGDDEDLHSRISVVRDHIDRFEWIDALRLWQRTRDIELGSVELKAPRSAVPAPLPREAGAPNREAA